MFLDLWFKKKINFILLWIKFWVKIKRIIRINWKAFLKSVWNIEILDKNKRLSDLYAKNQRSIVKNKVVYRKKNLGKIT